LDEITKNQETIIKKIRNTKYKLTICGQRADFSLHNPIVIPAKAGIHYKLLDPVFQRDGDWGLGSPEAELKEIERWNTLQY